MIAELVSLGLPAVSIGFVHCVCGPDHYVPFVAMSRVGLWSLRKTLVITVLCGLGHVLGSAIIGFIGIGLGLIVWQLQAQAVEATLGNAESMRGDLAGWLLFGFGIVYTLWGLYRGQRGSGVLLDEAIPAATGSDNSAKARTALLASSVNGPVSRSEGCNPYESGTAALNSSSPDAASPDGKGKRGELTPWILFTVFLFGPCEPLIPMLMIPAAENNMVGVIWITALFGLTTLLTMTTLVALIYMGAFAVRFPRLQTWGHAMAGSIVAVCGAAILLGL